ncbi:MAG: metallophosphoesterase, partial [Pseudomonadota bacterium]
MTRVPDGCAWLRVMGTSDVHAHLRGFDYVRNVEAKEWGLTRLSTCVTRARSEAPVSVLLDNGDILQGTPLAQVYSDPSHDSLHPVLEAMEAMGYDAFGLGNHEFNYGIDRLDQILSKTRLPVLCANVLSRKGAVVAEDKGLYPATLMLDRTVADPETGAEVNLRIGVLSVLPTQIMKWDGAHLKDRVETRDMVQSAARHAAQLRADGADVVILLAHTGIDPNGLGSDAENAALALAQIPSVDAMITGHTHQLFPSAAIRGQGIDVAAGTVFGTPTVMPGYRGAYLG